MHPYHEDRISPSYGEVGTLTDPSVRMDSLAPNVQKPPKGKNPERTDQERTFKTIILVNNLHCASCVSHVQTIVGGLYPAPLHISANILTHEVTVHHVADLHVQSIYQELHNAGFELRSLITEEEESNVVQEPVSRIRLGHTKDTS